MIDFIALMAIKKYLSNNYDISVSIIFICIPKIINIQKINSQQKSFSIFCFELILKHND